MVTGASSGIGEATALALAAEGANVAIVARRADRLDALAKRITDAGGTALPLAADMSEEAQVRSMVSQTRARFGRVDVLVNNAGVMLLGTIGDADTEDWRRMVNLNVLGLMYCTHAVLPAMKAQGAGHIVNISSTAGRTVNAMAGVYCATKHAVGAFSEALRQEVYKEKIRVTIIEPGVVQTELREHITQPRAKETIEAWAQSMRQLQSEDIAASIVLCRDRPASCQRQRNSDSSHRPGTLTAIPRPGL